MPTLKHLVIFLYVAELVAFAMLYASHRRRGQSLHENPVALLCAFMVLRLTVKMIYFYVEFYVLPWHLNILYNALMDTTYVLSVVLCLRVVRERTGAEVPRRRLLAFACVMYVALFALVELIWVDPASNHLIVFAGTLPQVIYTANEVLFLSVALWTIVSQAREAMRGGHVALARAMGVALSLYAVYVFLWDTSFTIPGVDAIRLIKPFDGVLVFAAALALIVARLCPPEEVAPAAAATPADAEPASSEPDLAAFASEYGLTAREAEVLALLFQGRSSTQVAEELVISTNTVKRHTYNLYRKAGVSNRFELLYKVTHPGQPIPAKSSENADE